MGHGSGNAEAAVRFHSAARQKALKDWQDRESAHLANWRNVQGMKTTVSARFKRQAQVLKALAHPARLCVVEELARGERCVCELAECAGVEMSTISRHLSLLRAAGVVEDEKRGAQVFYRLRARCVLNFFECLAALERARREEELPHAA